MPVSIPIEGSEAGSSSERSDMIALAGDSHEKAAASAFALALSHDAKGGLLPDFAREPFIMQIITVGRAGGLHRPP